MILLPFPTKTGQEIAIDYEKKRWIVTSIPSRTKLWGFREEESAQKFAREYLEDKYNVEV